MRCRVVRPEEHDRQKWAADIDGWWVEAIDEEHAKRIIACCNMAFAMGQRKVQAELRVALGMHAFGDHVPR